MRTTPSSLLAVESHDAEVEDADANDEVHLHMQEAVEVLLHLNCDSSTLTLQGQPDSETTAVLPVLTMTTSCTFIGDDAKRRLPDDRRNRLSGE